MIIDVLEPEKRLIGCRIEGRSDLWNSPHTLTFMGRGIFVFNIMFRFAEHDTEVLRLEVDSKLDPVRHSMHRSGYATRMTVREASFELEGLLLEKLDKKEITREMMSAAMQEIFKFRAEETRREEEKRQREEMERRHKYPVHYMGDVKPANVYTLTDDPMPEKETIVQKIKNFIRGYK